MIRFFDLGAGIGGFRLGLNALGWECVGWCEIDEYSILSYTANYRKTWFWNDVRTLIDDPLRRLPKFDVLTCGFPCQSFSLSGKRKGFEDTRGTFVFELLRIIKERQPEAFLLENVKGLVGMEKEFSFILEHLRKIGYRVSWKILNSRDFGVPQHRERVFIVGFWEPIKGLAVEFAWPQKLPRRGKLAEILEPNPPEKYFLSEKMAKTLLAHLERNRAKGAGWGLTVLNGEEEASPPLLSAYYRGPGGGGWPAILSVQDPWVSWSGQGGPGVREGEMYALRPRGQQSVFMRTLTTKTPTQPELCAVAVSVTPPHFPGDSRDYHLADHTQGLKANRSGTNEPRILQIRRGNGELVREYDNGATPTLTERMGTGGRNVPMLDGFRLRRLTPRECARLQGFPETFKIVVSDSQAYRQFGNAVTVPVVRAIGRQMDVLLG